jgi:hypothetical protein
MGKNRCERVEIWDGWVKKRRSKNIVSYALEVIVNGVTCEFVVHFKSSDTF